MRELVVLDSAPEPLFDSIVRMASEVCDAPIALLTLVDAERQWFKANLGLPGVNETPRAIAFCAHAIQSDDVLEVPDATHDQRFADNPLVTGSPDIRFYAGAPLVLPQGERVGTLCVIDRQARGLSDAQREKLRALAVMATQALVMRRDLIRNSLSVRSEYETALVKSEAKYRALIEQQAELVSLAEPDGKLIYMNQAYARHFGLTPEQMISRNLFDFVAASDRPMVRARIAAVLADGTTRFGENRMESADGTGHWLSWTNTLQLDEHGDRMLHSVGRDITERKQLEQRLADNERFTRHVTDNVPVRIAYVDSRRRYRFVNQVHAESMGLDRDEIVDRTRAELMQGPDETLIARRVDAALSGQRQQFEFEDTVGGARHLIDSQLLPDVADNGDVRGYFSIGVDVTERAAAERALLELAAIFKNTTDYVVQADPEGRISYLNPSMRQAIGLAPDTPLPRLHFSDFNPPEVNRLFKRVIMPAVRSGQVWVGETTVYLEHRREVTVSQLVIAHRDGQGRITRFSSVMRDISEAVEAKAEAARQTAIVRSVAEAIPSSVAVFGADGCYQFVNRAFEQWCGLPRDQILGREASALLGEQEFNRRRPWI
ncbi:MAG: PAS domain S-box protein, partial [Burkholderiales bacterium]